MKNLISLNDLTMDELYEIFEKADFYKERPFERTMNNKCIVMFFPETSIRSRITFEQAIYNMGGNSILFPSETLVKKEEIRDVIGYLNNWADCIVVRSNNINVIEEISQYSNCPVINGLSDINHPCEIIADLYSLNKINANIFDAQFLYVGPKGNIGMAWYEASEAFHISYKQCCPQGYEIEGVIVENCLEKAISETDVLITDSLSKDLLKEFKNYKITAELLNKGKKNLLFNPCPPFYRGEEVSEDAILHPAFVGYSFKKPLLNVQQAIIDYCINK